MLPIAAPKCSKYVASSAVAIEDTTRKKHQNFRPPIEKSPPFFWGLLSSNRIEITPNQYVNRTNTAPPSKAGYENDEFLARIVSSPKKITDIAKVIKPTIISKNRPGGC